LAQLDAERGVHLEKDKWGYRAKALELLAQAEIAKDADTRGNFESLAAAFLRLAMRVERNEGVVIDFVLPPQD